MRTQCVVGFLAMHDSPMGGKGQSTTHENHRSCLHLILVTNCSRGEGRRSTQGLSNRLLWTVMSFHGCSSFDVKMHARGPSADASWNSPRFPKRPDDQHFRECMQTKPIARKKNGIFARRLARNRCDRAIPSVINRVESWSPKLLRRIIPFYIFHTGSLR